MPTSPEPTPSNLAAPTPVTPELLRGWPLPATAGSKYGRGQVVVVGGALRSPGAAMLAGVSALRVGAGRLTLAVGRSVAAAVATSIVESGVVPLDETADGHVEGAGIHLAAADLADADAVLIGPGLDDIKQTERLVSAVPSLVGDDTVVLLDAYALGVLPHLPAVSSALAGRLVLTPNTSEAARLLDTDEIDELTIDDVRTIAERYDATVSSSGFVASPDGTAWVIGTGTGGLATSGSGDVLAGAITGLLARGAEAAQAAVWGTHLHAVAGDRLAVEVGATGYLAREIPAWLPRVLVELGS